MSTPILDILMKLRDPLVHLPCCPTILQYDPGQIIYSPRDPATSFYLIIRGIVKIAETSPDGRQVILDVYTDEEFFGETALLNVPTRRNQASTMQETTLLAWGVQEFHDLLLTRPGLSFALLQTFAHRLNASQKRLTSLAQDSVEHRLLQLLVRLADRIGSVDTKGFTRLLPLSHLLLAQHIGTSREIITVYMNRFRDRGLLAYSRKEIVIFGDGLKRLLEKEYGEVEDPKDRIPQPGAGEESSLRSMLARSRAGSLLGPILPKAARKPATPD